MEARVLPDAATAGGLAASLDAVAREAGVDVKDCYQCGKCSAGCPMAASADTTPREIIRYLQLGQLDAALASNMPWYCVGCGMCLARCPQKVDLPSLMAALRHAGKDAGVVPVPDIQHFDTAFMRYVRAGGVSNEVLLAMEYNLSTGHLFQDVPNSPKMLALGMINAHAHKVEGAGEVRDIIDKVRARKKAAGEEPQAEGGAQA